MWALLPHTHLRGKKWDYKLILPGGETKTILSVPNYDFNWQTYYMFKEPLHRAEGREDRLDGVVRQLRRATSRIPIRRRT